MVTRVNINELIVEGRFPESSIERRHLVGSYGRGNVVATPAQTWDGFGWTTLHTNDQGRVSSGGVWRSKGASWASKKTKPFASNVVIWNIDQMMEQIKHYWNHYSEEERADIEKALDGYGIRTKSTTEARRSSPFVQWSERASQPTPVDAGTESGGPVQSGWLTTAQEGELRTP